MEYFRWRNDYEPGYCVIDIPRIDDEPLAAGQSLISTWPEDVTTTMDDNFPDDIELADNLYGSYYPIVSNNIKQFLLQQLPAESVEFLPIKVINHEGRAEKAEYFILHPKTIIDCIDQEASMVDWNPLDSTKLMGCMGLVLNKENIPDDCKLFRLKHWGTKILIRSDLVNLLEAQGFTGLYFPEAEGYDGIG